MDEKGLQCLIKDFIKIVMESENKGITLIIRHDTSGYTIKYKYSTM